MTSTEERLQRVEDLLKANDLHELHCPALTNPPSQAFFGFNVGKDLCDCWLSKNHPEFPNKGYVIVGSDNSILEDLLFASRRGAVEHLTDIYGLSRDSKADNYWKLSFVITEGSVKPQAESATE